MRQTTSGLVLAPALLRLSAFLIDAAILLVINLALAGVGVIETANGRPQNAEGVIMLMLVAAAYHIGFVAAKSATPGKIAMNIYVAYPDGSAVRPDTAILRYIVLLIENFFVVGTIISIMLIFTDRDRRTIHDRAAGTLVLAGRAGAPLRPE